MDLLKLAWSLWTELRVHRGQSLMTLRNQWLVERVFCFEILLFEQGGELFDDALGLAWVLVVFKLDDLVFADSPFASAGFLGILNCYIFILRVADAGSVKDEQFVR